MAALGTRSLTLTIDGNEVTGEISKGVVTSGEAESDFVTFEEAAAGGKREYRLDIIAVQDAASSSFWDLVWSSSGTTVPYVLRPYGNEVPSEAQPHYTGNAIVSEPDGDFLGGEADASASAKFVIETSWELTGKPTKVTVAE